MKRKNERAGRSQKNVIFEDSAIGNVTQTGDFNTAIILGSNESLSSKSFVEFEQKYRAVVKDRCGRIRVPFFDQAEGLDVESFYVNPFFESHSSSLKSGKDSDSISLNDFLLTLNRTVVLGMPGGGKSTLSLKLCHALASNGLSADTRIASLLPILVVLRDYSQTCKAYTDRSILEHIVGSCKSDLQIEVHHDIIETLLDDGKVFVIFDGIDELVDVSLRTKVRDNVESFCALYSKCPVLITSREVGYGAAPLNRDVFTVYKLSSFNQLQIQELVTKWFDHVPNLNGTQREAKVKGFLSESKHVRELTTNPLLLSLMCNIYRRKNYLPKNRPSVYEACADMLFEDWDKCRGIEKEIDSCYLRDIEHYGKPLTAFIAHEIYKSKKRTVGLLEVELLQLSQKYLSKKYEDKEKAEAFGRAFIKMCKGRAWIFTNVGTSADGNELYKFTHQTFLEYFTALHLVRIQSVQETLNYFTPKISRQEWDMVAQLVFQMQTRRYDSAADVLLAGLLKNSKEAQRVSRENVLFFILRCLNFITPKEKLIKQIASECLLYALNNNSVADPPKETPVQSDRIPIAFLLVSALAGVSLEHPEPVSQVIEAVIAKNINSKDLNTAALAASFLLTFQNHLLISFNDSDESLIVDQMIDRLIEENKARIVELSKSVLYLSVEAYGKKLVSAKFIFDNFGYRGLFGVPECPEFSSSSMPLASILLFSAHAELVLSKAGSIRNGLENLRFIGTLVKDCAIPLFSIDDVATTSVGKFHGQFLLLRMAQRIMAELDFNESNAEFGNLYLYVLAVLVEVSAAQNRHLVDEWLDFDKSKSGILKVFVASRFGQAELDREKCNWIDEKLWAWSRREFDFVVA